LCRESGGSRTNATPKDLSAGHGLSPFDSAINDINESFKHFETNDDLSSPPVSLEAIAIITELPKVPALEYVIKPLAGSRTIFHSQNKRKLIVLFKEPKLF
jgi:hypothetical protein